MVRDMEYLREKIKAYHHEEHEVFYFFVLFALFVPPRGDYFWLRGE